MKPFVCILIPLFFAFHSTGQNYQLWNSSTVKIFEGQIGFRGAKIDSVFTLGTDSVFYPTRTVQAEDPYTTQSFICYEVGRNGWVGEKIRMNPQTGLHRIYTAQGDSIEIHVQAEPGDTWVAQDLGSGAYFQGEVLSVNWEETSLGIPDSVKRIKFRMINSEGESSEIDYMNDTLMLSKEYGLLNTWRFSFLTGWYEPYITNIDDASGGFYHLVGFENDTLRAGIANLTREDIYDFDPGDVLHLLEEFDGGGIARVREILDRDDSGPTPVFETLVLDINFNGNFDDNPEITAVFHDTLSTGDGLFGAWLFQGEANVSKLPWEPVPDNIYLGNYTKLTMTLDENGRRRKHNYQELYSLIYDEWDECWYISGIGTLCPPNNVFHNFIEGLGGPYQECSNYSHNLVYYVKGEEEWGTPMDFSTILASEDRHSANGIRLYPNPAGEVLYIEVSEAMETMVISDLSGKVVRRFANFSPKTLRSIDLSGLAPGIYVCIFTDRRGARSAMRLSVDK
jgi:hypothetical protein